MDEDEEAVADNEATGSVDESANSGARGDAGTPDLEEVPGALVPPTSSVSAHTTSAAQQLFVTVFGITAALLMVYGVAWVIVFTFAETIEAMFVPWLFSSSPERLAFSMREIGVAFGFGAIIGGAKTLVDRAALS